MDVNKDHKKSPPKRARALKPIERVPTKKLIESVKRDIERAIQESESTEKVEKK